MTTLKQDELELWSKYRQGDKKALNDLLVSMSPVINSQVNKFKKAPIPRYALKNEAKVLAVKAFDTYDPNRSQLNTHVINNLKHLHRYVIKYQNIGKIPEHRALQISRFNNIKSNLAEELGREPTILELADELSWSPSEVERLESELRSDLIMTGNETTFFDYTKEDPDTDLRDAVHFVYYSLSGEDKKILEYSWGISGPKKSVSEMSKLLSKPDYYIRIRQKKIAKQIAEARGLV